QRYALAPYVRAADPVNAADLAIEGGIPWLHIWIPNQIGELFAIRRERKIGSSTGADLNRVTAVDANAIGDDEPLVVERERPHQRDPQQRRIGIVIDPLAQILIDLSASRPLIADETELRSVRIRRLSANEKAIK